MMFNDTTRLRHITRPSLKDAFSDSPSNGSGSGAGLGRRGISQSFKEKLASPVRPREPPPPPPPAPAAGTQPSPDATFIYDIDENEEDESGLEKKAGPVKILHTSSSIFSTNSLKKLKPPKSSKKERSKSFTPKSKMDLVTKASIFNRSFSQIPKSFSYNSLDRGKAKKNKAKLAASSSSGGNLDMGPHGSAAGGHHHHQQQHLSSADLVTIIPPLDEQERMTFKDIRKILSSPSISSADNSSLSSTQSFNPSGASSKVLDSSSRGSPSKRYNDANSMEHIYEEIPDPNLVKTKGKGKRPLPPLPGNLTMSNNFWSFFVTR